MDTLTNTFKFFSIVFAIGLFTLSPLASASNAWTRDTPIDTALVDDQIWELYYQARENPDSTRRAARLLLNASRDSLPPDLKSYLFEIIGDCYYMTANYDSALHYLYEARMRMEENQDTYSLGYNSDYLGNVFNEIGLHDEAAQHYLDAKRIFLEYEDHWGLSNVSYGLSLLYYERGDYLKSLEYCNESYEHVIIEGDSSGFSSLFTQFASIYTELGEYDTAQQLAILAIKYDQWFDSSKTDRSFALGALADVYARTGNFEAARVHADSAYALSKEVGDPYASIFFQNISARILAGEGNLDSAWSLLFSLRHLSNDLKSVSAKSATFNTIVSLARETGEWKLAMHYTDSLEELSKDVFDDNLRLIFLEEDLKSERELAEKLQMDKEMSDLRSERNSLLLALVIIAALIAVVALILQWRANIRARKINEVLAANNEMVNNTNQELAKQRNILERNQIMLQKSNLDKDKLLALITHDLRSPLTQVKSVSELILEDLITAEEQKDFFTKIHESVDKSLANITDVLVWAKSQMDDGFKVTLKNVNACRAFRNAYSMVETIYHEKEIQLKFDCPDEHLMLYCDPARLEAVLRNVLSNAVKFSPRGNQVQCSITENDGFVNFIVEDQGVGMSKELVDSILNNTAHPTTPGTENERGTGTGFKIVKEYIDLDNGILKIDSEPGKGTKVQVALPRRLSE